MFPNHMFDGGFFTGWMVFGWLMMIVWWALIIGAVILIVRALVRNASGTPSGHSALDIIKERYAKGEITKKEFEEMKRELTKQ